MTTKARSLPTFLRQQLKVRGSTEHNGRGAFEMDVDCGYTELMTRVTLKIPKWVADGIVSSYTETDDLVEVYFDTKVFGFYSHFRISRNYGVRVLMQFDPVALVP